MEVRLDSNVRIYMPEDGDVVIRKGVVHSLRTFKGEECAFYERTDPMVGYVRFLTLIRVLNAWNRTRRKRFSFAIL